MERYVESSNVNNVEDMKGVMKDYLAKKCMELYDGSIKDISKLKWLDNLANAYIISLDCEAFDKDEDGCREMYRDIDNVIKYYKSKRISYYTKGDGSRVEVVDTVLSLDYNSDKGNMYNTVDMTLDDVYSISEDKMVALSLIQKFVRVQDALIKADNRRTQLWYSLNDYLLETDRKKRYKKKEGLKKVFNLTVEGIKVADLIKEMLDNRVCKGYLLDSDFNIDEYFEALEV